MTSASDLLLSIQSQISIIEQQGLEARFMSFNEEGWAEWYTHPANTDIDLPFSLWPSQPQPAVVHTSDEPEALAYMASNQRFSSALRSIFMEVRPGLFALWSWGGAGKLLYLGEDLGELVAAYRAREPYIPPQHKEASRLLAGIDLNSLEIDL